MDEEQQEKPAPKLGTINITKPGVGGSRISLLIWGLSGTGKTTLACTMPGNKLLLNFDPDGPMSIAHRNDVDVADFSDQPERITEQFKNRDNPLGLKSVINDYDSYIFDSTTNAQHLTIMQGIATEKGATIERPSPGAYGVRLALMTQAIKNILRITKQHNKHVAFISHEAHPQTNKEGNVVQISPALGGQLVTNAPVDFSEVWCLFDQGNKRQILIRPARLRRPCKTRMFNTTGAAEFEWENNEHNIEDWYNAWCANEFKKLPLPK